MLQATISEGAPRLSRRCHWWRYSLKQDIDNTFPGRVGVFGVESKNGFYLSAPIDTLNRCQYPHKAKARLQRTKAVASALCPRMLGQALIIDVERAAYVYPQKEICQRSYWSQRNRICREHEGNWRRKSASAEKEISEEKEHEVYQQQLLDRQDPS